MSDAADDAAAAAAPDYMGDLSALLPADDPKPSKRPKLKPNSNPNPDPKTKQRSSLSWQQRRQLDRDRRQMEEDKLTAAALATAAIPSSNIGFKLLSRMGYNPNDNTAADPVAPEIRRTRAGIGAEDPAAAAARKEKEREEKNRRREEKMRNRDEEMEREFEEKQKLEWRYRRVVADFRKAEAALAQLEKREVVPDNKNEDEEEKGDEEEEEEVITEEDLLNLLLKLRNEHRYCLYCGCQYESAEALQKECPGLTEDEH